MTATVAMLANVVDIVLGFGGEMVTYGAKPAAEWFDVFQQNPFEGLYALGILNIVYMLGILPVFVGMLVVHRHTHPVSAGFARLLSVLATGIYSRRTRPSRGSNSRNSMPSRRRMLTIRRVAVRSDH